jgi:hypothetical protein
MSDHEMVWTFDNDYVSGEVVCLAPADAVCHQRPKSPCVCENWDLKKDEKDEVGYYHEYDGEQHRHAPVPDCGVLEWLNDSPLECAADDAWRFEIARTPIEPVWQGDYMQWRPAS